MQALIRLAPLYAWLSACLLMNACACSTPIATPDAGDDGGNAEPDAGFDAGPPADDAGPEDAGAALDAGSDDAGSPDAGAPDAGLLDAGVPDAGCTEPEGAQPCSGDLACCEGSCIDTSADPAHCGACGNACESAQFCSSEPRCEEVSFANLCANLDLVALHDGQSSDNDAADRMAAAVAALCSVTARSAAASDPTVVEAGTHRLLLRAGSLVMVAGGPYFQVALRPFESAGITPVYAAGDGQPLVRLVERATDETIIEADLNDVGVTHDYFVIQIISDPVGGALLVVGYGFLAPGTEAAAHYFSEVMVPDIDNIDDTWRVVRWDDDGSDSVDAADTFTVIASSSGGAGGN